MWQIPFFWTLQICSCYPVQTFVPLRFCGLTLDPYFLPVHRKQCLHRDGFDGFYCCPPNMRDKRENGSWQSADLLQNLHEFLNLRWYWEPRGVSPKLAKGCYKPQIYKPQTTFVKHLCRPKQLFLLAHLKWSWVFHCPPQRGRDGVFEMKYVFYPNVHVSYVLWKGWVSIKRRNES